MATPANTSQYSDEGRADLRALSQRLAERFPHTVPTGEVVERKVCGERIEYVVLNSLVPSNLGANLLLSAAKRSREHSQRATTSDTDAWAFHTQSTPDQQKTSRQNVRHELEADLARARQQREQQAAAERAQAQAEKRLNEERENAMKAKDAAQIAAKRQQQLELRQAAEDAASRRREERRRGSASDSQTGGGLAIGGGDVSIQRQHESRDSLQQYWVHQMDERKSRQRNERDAEKVAAGWDSGIGQQRAQSARSRDDLRHELEADLARARQQREQQAAAERAQAQAEKRLNEERENAMKAKDAAQIAAKRQQQLELRQAAEDAASRRRLSHSRQATGKVGSSSNDNSGEFGKRYSTAENVLIRCPVTQKLLPPEAFNLRVR